MAPRRGAKGRINGREDEAGHRAGGGEPPRKPAKVVPCSGSVTFGVRGLDNPDLSFTAMRLARPVDTLGTLPQPRPAPTKSATATSAMTAVHSSSFRSG